MTTAPLPLVALLLATAGCPRRAPEAGGTAARPPQAQGRAEPGTPPPMPGEPPPAPPAPREEEFSSAPDGSSRELLGVAVPLSGRYKSWGEAILEGVAIAIEGTGQRLVARDTRGEPDGAAEAIAALAAEGAIAVVGGVTNAEGARAAAAAQELRIPLVSLSRVEAVTDAGPFVFRNMLTAQAQARALAELAMGRRGMRRFALMWPANAYGQELAHAFWSEVEARGGEIRGAEPYEPDRTTFGPLVKSMTGKLHLDERPDYVAAAKEITDKEKDPYRRRRALEKLRDSLPPITDFDAVFVPDFARNVALVAPALAVEDVVTATCDPRELERVRKTTGREDLKPVQLLGSNGWDDPSLVEKAGRYVQCSVFVDGFFPGSDRPETRRFVDAFHARYGRPPAILEASAHDAAAALRQVIAASPASRDAVRAGLSGLRSFAGATGTFSFDERREVVKPLFFLTVDGAGIRELRPQELAAPAAG
jgi:ABC-type branched-subunit amino acid transport system substrate-binding protein